MVFSNNFVASVKWNGKICREHVEKGSGNVYIPFGSEYSILLKNLNTKRALVNVEIDGRSAISGLIIDANKSVDLERFFEDDMNSGHRFKFIEKTDDIKEYRGDKIEDGIIRIEYQFEKEYPKLYRNMVYTYTPYNFGNEIIGNSLLSSNITYTSDVTLDSVCDVRSFNNTDGITVEGTQSQQSFEYGYFGVPEDTKHCINIQLLGTFPKKEKVNAPLLVSKKIQCNYCGKKYKSSEKFCGNCGSALI